MFVDRAEVVLRAGNGGDGILSFRHEKFRQKGGPDGGDGGDGGDVVLKASRNENTLADFRHQKLLKAESGKAGSKAKRHGKSGQDLAIDVPVGTMVKVGTEVLADLTADGQQAVVAKGGKGGFGNAHFTSSTRQAPRVAEKGEKGEEITAQLELKMIADAGIVGLPNAGKSTLLSVISNAHPEIADYPFTTLRPNLGVADIDKSHSLLFADIPGLIEGASKGKGLGDEFLRHVERTSALLHLIDVYGENVVRDYKTIMSELKAYEIDLSRRPQVVALTKIEGFDKKQLDKKIKALKKVIPKGTPVLAISSQSGENVAELLRAVLKRVQQARKAPKRRLKKPTLPVIGLKARDKEEAWQISQKGKTFVVTGKKIERFAQRTNFDDFYGQQRLRDIMSRLGIMRELQRRGAKAGQTITIGQPAIGELEF